MREILFRGKRADNGEWVEGSLVSYFKGKSASIFESKSKAYHPVGTTTFCSTSLYDVLPETVGQYTGLTDKNGRKIFEGDIVEGNSEYFTYTHPYGKVVYDGGQYLISFDDVLEDIECLGAWANDVEIIGNIYDNPELVR